MSATIDAAMCREVYEYRRILRTDGTSDYYRILITAGVAILLVLLSRPVQAEDVIAVTRMPSEETQSILDVIAKNRMAVRELSGTFLYKERFELPSGTQSLGVYAGNDRSAIVHVPSLATSTEKLVWATDGDRIRVTLTKSRTEEGASGAIAESTHAYDCVWDGKNGTLHYPDSQMANIYANRVALEEDFLARDPRGISLSGQDIFEGIEDGASMISLRNDRIGETQVVVLIRKAEGERVEYWCDPKAGYVPLRIITYENDKEDVWSETNIQQYTTIDGVGWVITESTTLSRHFLGGVATVHFKAENVHVGPVPDSMYEIDIPDNTLVHEMTTDITFIKGGAVPRPDIVDEILDQQIREGFQALSVSNDVPVKDSVPADSAIEWPLMSNIEGGKPPAVKIPPPLWLIGISFLATVLTAGGIWCRLRKKNCPAQDERSA